MITRRRARLRIVERTSSSQFQLWLKHLDVYEGMAQVSPRVHASLLRVPQSDEGAGSVRGGTMRRALFQCEPYVNLNITRILRAQLHESLEGQ